MIGELFRFTFKVIVVAVVILEMNPRYFHDKSPGPRMGGEIAYRTTSGFSIGHKKGE